MTSERLLVAKGVDSRGQRRAVPSCRQWSSSVQPPTSPSLMIRTTSKALPRSHHCGIPAVPLRVKRSRRAISVGESLDKLNACVPVLHRCDAGKHVARQQPQRQLVGVVPNDGIVRRQVEQCSDRPRCTSSALRVRRR
jgi:hypothetical protein